MKKIPVLLLALCLGSMSFAQTPPPAPKPALKSVLFEGSIGVGALCRHAMSDPNSTIGGYACKFAAAPGANIMFHVAGMYVGPGVSLVTTGGSIAPAGSLNFASADSLSEISVGAVFDQKGNPSAFVAYKVGGTVFNGK